MSADDDGPTTLRCRLLGHRWVRRFAVGQAFEVCARCGRAQRVTGGDP